MEIVNYMQIKFSLYLGNSLGLILKFPTIFTQNTSDEDVSREIHQGNVKGSQLQVMLSCKYKTCHGQTIIQE